MRPQYDRRALRAIAALGAAVLVVALAAMASAAVPPAPAAAVGASAVHVATPRGLFPAPIALARRAGLAASTATAPRRHRSRRLHRAMRRLRLHAVMLHPDVLVGQDVAFVGMTRPGLARRLIGVQRRLGSRWVDVARARTDRRGRFLARYWPHVLGRARLRVRVAGRRGRSATVVEPVATVFREVVASWYGPGGTTACGETLTAGTLGVANRTLPCGTMVTLRYRGRAVRVPVIDRGPYVAGRDYDLTYATKLALGAGDLTSIWASA
jgi:rare lipoprotein A